MFINFNPNYQMEPGHIWREKQAAKMGREADFTDGHWYNRKVILNRRVRTKKLFNKKGHDGIRTVCCGRWEGWER